jgi:phosphoribosylanthranilate isomerase
MTWIKICGMTNLEDARIAVEAGADAVGFVFYEKSPRNITVEAAREIVERLPESVEKIGVFVPGDGIEPWKIVLQAGLTGWQTYLSAAGGRQSGGNMGVDVDLLPRLTRFLRSLPLNLFGEGEEQIRDLASSFAMRGKNLREGLPLPEGLLNTIVLDSGDLRQPGGTGKMFDWKAAVPVAEGMRQGGVKLVVAGGLTPDNVGRAMEILKPGGVDVVSGVEARPGKKDPEKVRTFVQAVRAADRKAS